MNPEYESKLSALLDYIGSTAKDADGFVREQAPLVAQEIVAWKLGYGLFIVGFGTALLVFGVFMIRAVVREAKRPFADQREFVFVGAGIAGMFGVLIGSINFGCGAYDVLRATVAPRLVILDYVKSVAK